MSPAHARGPAPTSAAPTSTASSSATPSPTGRRTRQCARARRGGEGTHLRTRGRPPPSLPWETSAKGRVSGASRVLRWVPDRLPLRFAALQASGKALLRERAPISSAAFPGACSAAECDPGPSARSRREAAPNLTRSQRSPFGRGEHLLSFAVSRSYEETPMTVSIGHLQPIIALLAGILILVMPRLLNYIVAIYLIAIGIIGLGLFR